MIEVTGRVKKLIELNRLKRTQKIIDAGGEVMEVVTAVGSSGAATDDNQFAQLLYRQLKWFMDAMKPHPPGVAPNMALQENVFMMVVCAASKIPLIVVGQPGR